MRQGDIYHVTLEPVRGHEQRGYRPVLVLSPEAFNRFTRTPLVAPITNGGQFARRNGFAVDLDGFGLKTTGIVRCDQVRTIDLQERGGRFVERVPQSIVDAARDLVATLLEDDEP